LFGEFGAYSRISGSTRGESDQPKSVSFMNGDIKMAGHLYLPNGLKTSDRYPVQTGGLFFHSAGRVHRDDCAISGTYSTYFGFRHGLRHCAALRGQHHASRHARSARPAILTRSRGSAHG
jgi:hypothetical protein